MIDEDSEEVREH